MPTTFSISTDDGTSWADVALPVPAQQGFSLMIQYQNVAIDRTGRLFLNAFTQHFSLPAGTTTWQPMTAQITGDFRAVGNYLYATFARSSDGGATFKQPTSLADVTFDYSFAGGAFAHRADPTLWLGDGSGSGMSLYGLIAGHMP